MPEKCLLIVYELLSEQRYIKIISIGMLNKALYLISGYCYKNHRLTFGVANLFYTNCTPFKIRYNFSTNSQKIR